MKEVRKIRDAIKEKVEEWLAEIEKDIVTEGDTPHLKG